MVLCISKPLFTEYYEVLNREKFSRFPDFHVNANVFLAELESKAVQFVPTSKVQIIGDEEENLLLELAEISKADYLITGNTKDFTMDNYKGTKIISPKRFYELINV